MCVVSVSDSKSFALSRPAALFADVAATAVLIRLSWSFLSALGEAVTRRRAKSRERERDGMRCENERGSTNTTRKESCFCKFDHSTQQLDYCFAFAAAVSRAQLVLWL